MRYLWNNILILNVINLSIFEHVNIPLPSRFLNLFLKEYSGGFEPHVTALLAYFIKIWLKNPHRKNGNSYAIKLMTHCIDIYSLNTSLLTKMSKACMAAKNGDWIISMISKKAVQNAFLLNTVILKSQIIAQPNQDGIVKDRQICVRHQQFSL
ncbi:hypothetical protein JXL19_13050 [bacterium]|nr:hypothetical protein [bacterium]